MMHKLLSLALALACGLESSTPISFNVYGLGSSPSGRFICNTTGKPSGYSRTRKQNLRNSQRKGKQYKQRKAA